MSPVFRITTHLLLVATLLACDSKPETAPATEPLEIIARTPAFAGDDQRQPCRDSHPDKRAFFGALHIHTSLSFDAWVFDNDNGPESAYAFARGEPIFSGPEQVRLQIDRPLDFAAVTDHAEQFGQIGICTDPAQEDYNHQVCHTIRGEVWWAALLPDNLSRLGRIFSSGGVGPTAVSVEEICPGDPTCTVQGGPVWERIQRAAEQSYDRSADCEFTSFVGYEYSLTTPDGGNNMHRNVLFRSAEVLNLPVSARLAKRPLELWRHLEAACNGADNGCQALAIPHNSNVSSGEMFAPQYADVESIEQQTEIASLRRRTEPLVEIYQSKGDSECRNGLYRVGGAPDEFCDFEKLRHESEGLEDCGDAIGDKGFAMTGCVSRRNFIRYVLTEGLEQRARLGVNPFELGIIAASDTHDSNGGDVDEYDNRSGLVLTDTPEERLQPETVLPGGVASVRQARFSPGGLAGVFAEQNTREDLFDAMQRREAFGTSGPRIVPRFFAANALPDSLCDSTDMIARAYAAGVPMGSTLTSSANSVSPDFLVAATADNGTTEHPGGLLQRLQVIKGWVDENGIMQQKVFDVAGTPDNGATVDVGSCQPRGEGFRSLCTVWQDPGFSDSQHAVYYARVLENPSCRWNTYQCNAFPADERPPTCDDPAYPKTIQERAWTSPIWYARQ
ncbi:DUF3604 domain-containing protein [Halieaceae bacterium IMCC14734]|uniref:DUF3604 domain-containing protein n=1 Tax=Candidatus Litorirhabdus singularis TaxID=2518993 RepID=A0ABT3TAI7_9GAMM|nr:DUF3604 domain-containing protein [Candidatus Litorirhabdus singularis]MCX2979293.1 DUF3604 domain-containing protein [Candidatus Litorirhabdus singularis]